jgi:hypothetical protein
MANGIFDLIAEVKRSWHRVTVPKGKGVEDINIWLDENCNGRYYFDTMSPELHTTSFGSVEEYINTVNLPVLYLESTDDTVFYNLTWEKYDR